MPGTDLLEVVAVALLEEAHLAALDNRDRALERVHRLNLERPLNEDLEKIRTPKHKTIMNTYEY